MADAGTGSTSARSGWEWLLRNAAVAVAAAVVLMMVLFRAVIPPLIVFVVLFGIGLWLLSKRPRAGAIMLGILSLLFLLGNLPFLIPPLAAPASTVDFVVSAVMVIAAVVAVVAAVMALVKRGRSSGDAPANVWRAAIGLTILAVVAGVAARATFEEDDPQQADIQLVTEAGEFSDESLESEGAKVSVFVENKDLALHTFTIDELDVDMEIPAGTGVRLSFDAEPGKTYEFYCRPHSEFMRGKLAVQ